MKLRVENMALPRLEPGLSGLRVRFYDNSTPTRLTDLYFILIILTLQPFSLKYRLSQRDRGTDGIRLSYVVRATHRSQKAHTITYSLAIRGLAQVLSIHPTLYPNICLG